MHNKNKTINIINIPDNLAKKYIIQKSNKYFYTVFNQNKKARLKDIKTVKNKTVFMAA